MASLPHYLRWIVAHGLIFLLSPFSFILAGLLVGILVSIEPNLFSANNPLTYRHQALYNQALYLLAPLLTGLVLGILYSWQQLLAMRKIAPFSPPLRWITSGALGMGLACPAFAWVSSSSVFADPLLIASIFSAGVFGLVCALPQSQVLKTHVKDAWRWLLFSTLAFLLSFALICAPVWLPENSAFVWLVFLCSAAGGILFGLVTWIEFNNWLQRT